MEQNDFAFGEIEPPLSSASEVSTLLPTKTDDDEDLDIPFTPPHGEGSEPTTSGRTTRKKREAASSAESAPLERHTKRLRRTPCWIGSKGSPQSDSIPKSRTTSGEMSAGTSRKTSTDPISAGEDDLGGPSLDTRKTLSTGRKRQPLRGNWTAQHLLSNTKSKLVTANLINLLSTERAWTELSDEEQERLVALLPASIDTAVVRGQPSQNILKQSLLKNSCFRHHVALFQEDLGAGRYEPQWQKDAQTAMRLREQGHFDAWKEKNREEFWGQKQKIDWTSLAGDSSAHTLPTLVEEGCFKVGDVWSLHRGYKHGKAGIVVEKEAMITHIAPDNTLSFSFPPGRHKFSSSANGEDKILENVATPKALSDAILGEDGRIVDVRGANAWKEFRCSRKNQDMGSVWDIRELHHSKQKANRRK